jgi:hypothetical protein
MKTEAIKEHLIKAGVKNLEEFGYPDVNTENVLADEVYKEFFKSMLHDNLGHRKDIDSVILELLESLK